MGQTDDDAKHLSDTPRRQRRWLGPLLVGTAAVVALVVIAPIAGVAVMYLQARWDGGSDGEYVALGSSFGAGPGVGSPAADSPTLCWRSAANYAHELARMRNLKLIDATCSGSTAEQALHGGQYFQPPQVDSVGPHTRLVTITTGGNDVFYLPNMFGWSCANKSGGTPVAWRPLVCKTTSVEQEQQAFAALPATFDRLIATARQRAPSADIVVVDYITVLPSTGACPDRVPFTPAEFDRARAAAGRLKALTAAVAARNNVTLIKASELTAEHDVCSERPWVFGYTYPATPLNFGPIPYHPTAEAMSRVAAALDKTIDSALRN